MPDPKHYVDSKSTYVRGYIRRKRKKGISGMVLFWLLIGFVITCFFSTGWAIALLAIGIVVYAVVCWLQWRIWKIETKAKDNFLVYLIKGR